ncbi:LysM domain-containing protein [Pseudobutyrivibrio sp. UC1225]|uniref:LysM peptidoglycan-binding domain-containing protein n=1 Tax=Pseudobutyrivibrio sp. UC1225 TaxID=1798185 RepID=UPI0008F05AF6|nr:LysM peptidoglycan-binding domain-containing protein [Pseudobutyrivibrio sp. UC1225]SFN44144.1 LysM domain-containing protein [Pseudobutyrivibrio sp. UC1225]
MRKNTKAERIVRNRKIMLAVATVIVSFFIGFMLHSSKAAAENSRPVYTYYTSYEIQSGDTLWTVADQFMTPEFSDKEAFIDNIKKLNHIDGDKITAGKYIVIEYTSYNEL